LIESKPCAFYVETSDIPADLITIPQLLFEFVGKTIPIQVTATGPGRFGSVDQSKDLSVTSDNANVVTVRAGNQATAAAPGETQLRVSYHGFVKIIPARVAAVSRGDLNADGQVDQNDLKILTQYLNTTPTTTNDARDLNHDGKIDDADLQLLITLCTVKCTATDSTPPVVVPVVSGTMGTNGWYRSSVAVSWTIADPESGIASSSGCESTTLSTDTVGVTVTCTATNGVGLTTSVPISIKIDKTPPLARAIITPPPNASGWNNATASVTFTGTDNLSGIAFCSPAVAFTNEGLGQTASGTCTDEAGNVSIASSAIVKIDRTGPVISGMAASGCTLWPPNHKLIQVATVGATDSLSGLAPGSLRVTASSSEPSDPKDPDIVITSLGSGRFSVQLQADRAGNGSGRVYTIQASASDLAGNSSTVTSTCTVPHDQGR